MQNHHSDQLAGRKISCDWLCSRRDTKITIESNITKKVLQLWVCSGVHSQHLNQKQIKTISRNSIKWWTDGKIKPLISQTIPMKDAISAINMIGNRGVTGKVVLVNDEE